MYSRSSLIVTYLLSPVKGQIVNIVGFVGHGVSVVTTQPCCCSEETPRNRT